MSGHSRGSSHKALLLQLLVLCSLAALAPAQATALLSRLSEGYVKVTSSILQIFSFCWPVMKLLLSSLLFNSKSMNPWIKSTKFSTTNSISINSLNGQSNLIFSTYPHPSCLRGCDVQNSLQRMPVAHEPYVLICVRSYIT